MNKRFVIITVLLSVLFYAYAWAVDDTTIQELQTDVSSTKSKADKNAADIQSLRGGLPAVEERVTIIEDRLNSGEFIGPPGPPGPPGPQGPPGVCESCGSFTPPVITHNAPPCSTNFEEDINFTLSDDVELSHLIIQGDASPYIQLTQYFKPGVKDITITHTIGLNAGINEILVVAVDTEGNAKKILIEIEQSSYCNGDQNSDCDPWPDASDNCPYMPNEQLDNDADGVGDVCDTDDDNDGVVDDHDNCPFNQNSDQTDYDFDGFGDACDGDADGDFIDNEWDNCPFNPNGDQANNDADEVGDVCDTDDDNDGVVDVCDNCIFTPNPGQEDSDADGVGDACETI